MCPTIGDLKEFYKPRTDPWLSQAELFMPSPQNVVSTVELGCVVPLNRVIACLGFSSLRKSKLSVVTLRFAASRSKHLSNQKKNLPRVPTIQLFEGGQAVIVGATSEEISVFYSHVLRLFLINIGIPARCNKLVVWNRVCSGFYPYGIDTERFKEENEVTLVKDSGGFPGVMYVTGEFKLTLFPTGKFIVMGMGSEEDREKFLRVLPIFEKYKMCKSALVSKAQLGTDAVNRIIRKRGITDISKVDKATLLLIAKEAINSVDFGMK